MGIKLRSGILTVSKINKKSYASLFKNLKVGDQLMLSIEVEHLGTSRGRSYASYILIENLGNGETTKDSFNQITPILNCFEFKEEEGV
jgi:hypothetical protein